MSVGAPRFRRLPHTADCRLAVWGQSEEDLIRNAVAGTLRQALERPAGGRKGCWQRVAPWPSDSGGRIVAAVNHALFSLYSLRLVATDFALRRDRGFVRLAPLKRQVSLREVKAATFHALDPHRREGRLRVVLTLDL